VRRKAVWLLLLVGCAPDYAGFEVESVGPPEDGVSIANDRFGLRVGLVAFIYGRPRSSTAQLFESSDSVALVSRNDGVVQVLPHTEEWKWILVGRSGGTTCIEVRIDGYSEECIETIVREGGER